MITLSSALSVNLQDKLIAVNRKVLAIDTAALSHQAKLDAQIEKLRLGAEDTYRESIVRELGFEYKLVEATKVKATNTKWGHLPQERIFSREAIRKLCCTYGLRFLSTSLYKGELDAGIGPAVESFKRLNGGKLPEPLRYYSNRRGLSITESFMIAAPSSSFVLQERPKDPLLFIALDTERYYLIHKWGSDLSVLARVKNWPWNNVIPIALMVASGVLIHSLLKVCGVFADIGMSEKTAIARVVSAGALGLLSGGVLTVLFDIFTKRIERINASNWDIPFRA
jgi:hypothetical protein